jgi:hypothetical protein
LNDNKAGDNKNNNISPAENTSKPKNEKKPDSNEDCNFQNYYL